VTRARYALLAVLGGVVAVLGGILVLVADDEDGDDEVSTEATTTTTEDDSSTTSSSSTSSTSTSSTSSSTSTSTSVVATSTSATTGTTAVPAPRRVLLAQGDGWTVVRVEDLGRTCLELTSTAAAPVGACGIGAATDLLGDVLSVRVPDGMLVAATTTRPGSVGAWTNVGGARGILLDDVGVADPVLGAVVIAELEELPTVHLVVVDGEQVVAATGALPAGRHIARGATGLVSFGTRPGWSTFAGPGEGGHRSLTAGSYAGSGGRRCVAAFEIGPEPRVVLDRCGDVGSDLLGETVLLPTGRTGEFDVVAVASPDVARWECELPDGRACDFGTVALAPEGVDFRVLMHTGPIGVVGVRTDHLVFVLLDRDGDELGRMDVPTPS
jgi:hypothetical protein